MPLVQSFTWQTPNFASALQVLSEGGIASGVRRVEAVAGAAAVEHMNALDAVTRELGSQLRVRPAEMPAKVAGQSFSVTLAAAAYLVGCSMVTWGSLSSPAAAASISEMDAPLGWRFIV